MSEGVMTTNYQNQFDSRQPGRPAEAEAVGEQCSKPQSKPAVEVSVIIPVTERHDDVEEVYDIYKADLDNTNCVYEIIYVLDGEYPEALAALRDLRGRDESLKVIRFAHSFGESTAITAGFANSNGPLILTLPAYHQVAPGAVATILSELEHEDMIIARRWPRTDSSFNRLQTRLFFKVQRLLTAQEWHDLGCGVRAFRREVIDAVSIYGDQHRFLPVIAQRWGFKVKEVDLPQSSKDRYRRVYRPGVYLRRLLDLLTVFFLSKFTKKPLRFFGLIGSATAFSGVVVLAWLVIERLFFGVGMADRPIVLAGSLLVVVGVQIFGLGLLGELIIFTHAKEIKEYIIEEIIN